MVQLLFKLHPPFLDLAMLRLCQHKPVRYDGHKESILRGGDGTAKDGGEDEGPKIWELFSASAFTGFTDPVKVIPLWWWWRWWWWWCAGVATPPQEARFD